MRWDEMFLSEAGLSTQETTGDLAFSFSSLTNVPNSTTATVLSALVIFSLEGFSPGMLCFPLFVFLAPEGGVGVGAKTLRCFKVLYST